MAGVKVKRGMWVAALMSTAVLSSVLPQAVYAKGTGAQQKSFSVSAQSLDDALALFGQQAGIQISAHGDLVRGLRSPGVSGAYTTAEALSRLLTGTGLTWRFSGNTVVLERAPQAADGAVQLGPVRVEGAATSVTAYGSTIKATLTEGSGSYTGSRLSVGKGAQDISEIPQSITVVTRQRIEDQSMQTLGDVFKNTTGITTTQRDNEAIGRIYSRGFEIQNMQVDGSSVGPWSPLYFNPNLAMFDHVEVVRGADGLFSGNGTPGGAVNLVRKRPLAEPQFLFNARAGKWDRYRAEVDVTGGLLSDGKVRGRAVVAHEDRKGYIDNDWGRNTFLYGIVEFDVGPTTMISVGGNYEKEEKFAVSTGAPRGLDGSDLRLPRSWSASRYDWSTKSSESWAAFAQIEHKFANDWELKLNTSYGARDQDIVGANYIITSGVDPVTRNVNVVDRLSAAWSSTPMQAFEAKYVNADLNLNGSFQAFGQDHKFLIGADWAYFDAGENFRAYLPGIGEGGAWTGPIDQLAEAPRVYPYPTMANTQPYGGWSSTITQYGLYGRLNLSLTKRLTVIGGGRYAYYKSESPSYTYDLTSGDLISNSSTIFKDKGILIPYAGVVYKINKAWSAYASATEIYESQANYLSGPADSPSALPPITGRNYEVGVKGSIAEGKLTSSIALYRIERTGVALRDPAYPNSSLENGSSCCWLSGKGQVSSGVEFEISGELFKDFQLSAGYTYNKNTNELDNTIYHSVTPKHMVRVWSNYRLPGKYDAWSLGLGVNLQSKAYVSGTAYSYNEATGLYDGASIPFNYTQGAYAVWNAAVHYDINSEWRATLNINNVFDKRYYANLGYIFMGNIYGDPQNWMITLRKRF